MKWALVVYFMTTSGWQSAETLGKDKIGWSRLVYETYQQCSSRARMFNINRTRMFKEDHEYGNRVKKSVSVSRNRKEEKYYVKKI